MNKRFLTCALIVVCLSFIASKSYACSTAPTARIADYTERVCVGCAAEFDGLGSCVPPTGSYDYDNESPYGCGHGISKYEWDFGDESDPCTAATPSHTYTTAGTYTVELKVTDDDDPNQSDTTTCTVYVVKVEKVVKYGDPNETGPLYVCLNSTVDLEAKPDPADASFPTGEPHWTIEDQPQGASASLDPCSDSATTTLDNLDVTGDYIVRAKCGDDDDGDSITVIVVDMNFVEDTNQTYGYDDYTASDPWKSVRDSSNTDIAKAVIDPCSGANGVYFKSLTTANITVSPSNASTSPQTVTFTGITKDGSSDVWARLNSVDGQNVDLIKVKAYKQVAGSKTQVKLIYVTEDNDDVQDINVGNGKPNEICVNDGANNVLQTIGVEGDQTAGHWVTTGSDGICDTTANNLDPAGDDEQVIPVGEGKANQICISPGSNGKRDTNKSGNDGYTGESIHTGADGVCDTAANNTDIPPNTGLITAGGLQTYLNETVFNQCVANTFVVTDGGTVQVNYDVNRDGVLEHEAYTAGSEPKTIIDNAKDDGYDYNVFIVKDIESTILGYAYKDDEYCFVATDGTTATTLLNIIAHELGHAFGNLDNNVPAGDNVNLMYHGRNRTQDYKLRKTQWDTTQALHNPP